MKLKQLFTQSPAIKNGGKGWIDGVCAKSLRVFLRYRRRHLTFHIFWVRCSIFATVSVRSETNPCTSAKFFSIFTERSVWKSYKNLKYSMADSKELQSLNLKLFTFIYARPTIFYRFINTTFHSEIYFGRCEMISELMKRCKLCVKWWFELFFFFCSI